MQVTDHATTALLHYQLPQMPDVVVRSFMVSVVENTFFQPDLNVFAGIWHQAVQVQLEFPQFKQAGGCDSLCLLPGQGWRAHSHFPGVIGVGKLSWEWLFCPRCQYWPDGSCEALGLLSQKEEKLPQPSPVLWPSPLTVPTVQVLDVQNLLLWKFPGKRKWKFPVSVFQLKQFAHYWKWWASFTEGSILLYPNFVPVELFVLTQLSSRCLEKQENTGVFRSLLTE